MYVLANWIWNFHTTDKMWDSLSSSWCISFHFISLELIESKFNLWIVKFFYLLISVSQWNGPKQWIVNIINALFGKMESANVMWWRSDNHKWLLQHLAKVWLSLGILSSDHRSSFSQHLNRDHSNPFGVIWLPTPLMVDGWWVILNSIKFMHTDLITFIS